MFALVGWIPLAAHAAPPPFMRFPNASADRVAFVAHDQLWTAPLAGGRATELTHEAGYVVAPRFSPDGRFIAFTRWSADGRDIYVIPATGGTARRLTFDGKGDRGDNLVLSWTPDGSNILYLSSHGASNRLEYRLFELPLKGGLARDLGLDRAGLLSFAEDGRSIIYNRNFRNFELRKRYIGGQHPNLFRYDLSSKALTQLTFWKGTDTSPMVFHHKLFFVSDRDSNFRQNLWMLDLDTGRSRQITHFTDFDIDWPSIGAGGITFQQGGRLYRLDPATEQFGAIEVDVPDDGALTRPADIAAGAGVRVRDALNGLDYDLAPDGSTLLVSSHGDIIKLPIGGAPLNMTRSPGVDEDHPTSSPDGRWIAYTTDAAGEQQVAIRAAGGGAERLLTRSRAGYFYSAIWSPGSDRLAVADANHALWLIPLAGGGPELVARDPYAEIRDASFSPDGRWLAYSTQAADRLRAIHLREIATGRDTIVSSPMESDRLPVFTADGRYLAFVSQRNEQAFVSDRDDESLISTLNSDGIYLAPLDRETKAPRSGAGAYPPRPGGRVTIDLPGLMDRAVPLPVTPAVITALDARAGKLVYEAQPPQLIDGDLAGSHSALHALDLATLDDREIARDVDGYRLSADGSAAAYRQGDKWMLAATGAGGRSPVAYDLSAIRVPADPPRDWAEMLDHAWRLDRDVFFSPAMNGTDWDAVHHAYARLYPSIGSEQDFLYLLGQIQGEIATSHAFIDDPSVGPPLRKTALLGADYALDAGSGRYRFARIYGGDQSRPSMRGPLGAPGLGIKQGDYLLAVDGRELRAPAPPLSAFAGVKGAVTLTVAPTARGPRRDIMVDPIDNDLAVRRLDWARNNRALVDRLSGGRIGYITLSDFAEEGPKEFVRQFYPQLGKQALIFDERWNWGGFTSQAVLDVLRRLREGVFVNREGALSPLPTAAPPPAMVVLANYASASDGDQFPYYFRKYGLGPVVGTRTWGGTQGINRAWQLMDGTGILIPKDSLADRDGHWLIENEGTAPDIEVDTAPGEGAGVDPQIAAAVKAALGQLVTRPDVPARAPAWLPAYPPGGNVPGAAEPAPATAAR